MVTETMRAHPSGSGGRQEAPRYPPGLRVTLFAKFPEPGRVKTRLISELGADGAAGLHRRLVERTLATIRASGLAFEIRTEGGSDAAWQFWLGRDVAFVPQGGGDLGARLARVTPPVILVGADVPDLRPAHLIAAAQALARVKVAIGPAEDGGYNLLALSEPMPFLFDGMPWSTNRLYEETLARCRAHGVCIEILEQLADLDRPEDLRRWPVLWP